jgi:ABC-2 type transport system ATP-binding protein
LVQELIGNLSRSKCIILSTHILDEVERVCNRAMIISQGKILTDATPQALLAQAPNHHVIHVTLGQDNQAFCDLVQQQPWVAQVVKKTHTQLEIVPKNKENHLKQLMELTSGFPIEAISLEEGRLDDLFRSITKGVTA